MMGGLANHLWQSTLFAVVAGLLTVAFRKNRAQVRYWLWFSASIKFFVPFVLLLSLGSHLNWSPFARKVATQTVLPDVSSAMVQISEPFVFDNTPSATSTARTIDTLRLSIISIWAVGFAAIVLMRLRAWWRIRTAVHTSTPLQIPDLETPIGLELRTSPGLLEPGVIGMSRPILLLPAGINERLTPLQLKAVLAHELCHVRRRDNITSAIHMIAEAVFWFHPVVWWIGSRLVEERERSCDEEVLRLGSEPQDYAEGILNVCKTYLESPLRCVSGVTGADLKKRIQAILTGHVAGELNFAKKLTLTTAAIAVMVVPIATGMVGAPIIRAQAEAAARRQFEEASIKPCPQDPPNPTGVRGGGGNSLRMSPGRLHVECMTAATLIRTAYGYNPADPVLNSTGISLDIKFDRLYGLGIENGMRVRGGPSWARSDKYTIDAVGDGSVDAEILRGPMLLALLERRLMLKAHVESEQISGFALVIPKGGLKVKPMEEGGCIKRDPSAGPQPPPPAGELQRRMAAVRRGEKPPCGLMSGNDGPNVVAVGGGARLGGLSGMLALYLGIQVDDKTGLKDTDLFNFILEFGPDESTPGRPGQPRPADDSPSDIPPGPTIFAAMEQQLGLKLESIKVPREFIVIDRLERPVPN